MAMNIEIMPQLVIAYLSGEIDHHKAGGMRKELDTVLQQVCPEELILDFGNVTFMDSSGIGFVMGRYKLMTDLEGIVKVTNLSPSLKKVMKLAGMDKLGVLE
ncbi:MAG: anti-sigma factor antagonist [Oscillospiraceae bacterium]